MKINKINNWTWKSWLIGIIIIFVIILVIAQLVIIIRYKRDKNERRQIEQNAQELRAKCDISNLSDICKKQEIWECHNFHCHQICTESKDGHCVEEWQVTGKQPDDGLYRSHQH